MTPRKAGRRKSGKARRVSVEAWCVTDAGGWPHVNYQGLYRVYLSGRDARVAAERMGARVVPCEIVIGRRK